MSTLAKAKHVLELIVRLRRDVTVSDVSNELGMPKSSASRTLSAMRKHGFLDRSATTRAYRPGRIIMEASYHFRSTHGLLVLMEAQLERLIRETGYTAYIGILDGAHSLVIQMRVGAGTLQVYTPPGSRLPAHATSVGRAILARIPDAEVLQLFDEMMSASDKNHEIESPKQLLATLSRIRDSGWELSTDGAIEKVAGISTAVMDPSTHQVYGLSIAFPAQHLTDELVKNFSRIIIDVAQGLGQRVGDPYWLAFGPKDES